MRGLGSTSTEVSEYQRGFLGGVVTSGTLLAGVHAIKWALSTPVIHEFGSWATTAQFAPIDLVNFVVIGVIVWAFWIMNQLFGGVSR